MSTLSIKQAAEILANGQLLAFPTETVFGLGADAENAQAISAIYQAKGRPHDHPVIVHIATDVDINYWSRHIPASAQALIDTFWPGPLTLILKRSSHVLNEVSGGQDNVGIRCPSHPVAQQLLRAFASLKQHGQGGVAAPSANKFGQVSPTSVEHVQQEFATEILEGKINILTGAIATIGIESTILDVSRLDQGVPATLLRPGHINRQQLAEVLGYEPLSPDQQAPRASGTLKAHYAPHTPLYWLSEQQRKQGILNHKPDGQRWAVLLINESQEQDVSDDTGNKVCQSNASSLNNNTNDKWPLLEGIDYRWMPNNPVQYAHELYAVLRAVDRLGYQRLLVQELPKGTQWEAVRDRLRRATAAFDL